MKIGHTHKRGYYRRFSKAGSRRHMAEAPEARFSKAGSQNHLAELTEGLEGRFSKPGLLHHKKRKNFVLQIFFLS